MAVAGRLGWSFSIAWTVIMFTDDACGARADVRQFVSRLKTAAAGAGRKSEWTASNRQEHRVIHESDLISAETVVEVDGKSQINGQPLAYRNLSSDPPILYLEDVLSPAECASLISVAEPHLVSSQTIDIADPDHSDSNFGRTSLSYILPASSNHPIAMKLQSIAALLGGVSDCFVEDVQVVRYLPGQYYLPHYDWFQTIPENDRSGQRTLTLFMYLNHIDPALELDCPPSLHPACIPHASTYFPLLDLSIFPQAGSGVFWKNIHASGEGDTRTLHQGIAPRVSIKWGANVWVRQKPVRDKCHGL